MFYVDLLLTTEYKLNARDSHTGKYETCCLVAQPGFAEVRRGALFSFFFDLGSPLNK